VSLIKNLVPVNLESEKQRFFSTGGEINPQFTYPKVYASKVLQKYGLPKDDYLARALTYLRDHPLNQQVTLVGEALRLDELAEILRDLCVKLGIAPITLQTNQTQNSRFMMVNANTLSVRWPARVTRSEFMGVLDHEIQTHLLRRLNEQKQPWYQDKSRRNKLWKMTEEGLATYNSKDKIDPDLRQAAWLYRLVDLAAHADFITVYRENIVAGFGREKAFTNTLRVKRGVCDTSQPGGFTKDLVYWEGYWLVADYLRDPAHDIKDLYWGKVGIEELEDLRARAVTTGLLYPTFVTTN